MRDVFIFIVGFFLGVGVCYAYPDLVTDQVERGSAAVEAYRQSGDQ